MDHLFPPRDSSFLLDRFLSRLRRPSPSPAPSVPASPSWRGQGQGGPRVRPTKARARQASVSSAMPVLEHQSRFYTRLLKWLKSKTVRRRSSRRRHSTEIHSKCRYRITNVDIEEPSFRLLHNAAAMPAAASVSASAFSTARSSWADCSLAEALACARRSSDYSRNLAPPPNGLSTSRDFSVESGYHSHSSLSTPATPARSQTGPRLRRGSRPAAAAAAAGAANLRGVTGGAVPLGKTSSITPPMLSSKSVSVDASTSSPPSSCVRSQARSFMNWRSEDSPSESLRDLEATSAGERRRQFRLVNSVFHEVVEDPVVEAEAKQPQQSVEDLSSAAAVESCLGEWRIPHEEVTFGQRLVDGGSFGHNVFLGRWHGDVVIHSFRTSDHDDVRNYVRNVRKLTQIRHENIVLYMGASVRENGMYSIITNPVKAESLHSWLLQKATLPVDVEYTVSVAKQLSNAMGYLHAKDIVHGRICSRNVFLEGKVQLSLLDYAVGSANTVYSSPQVLTKQHMQQGQRRVFRGKEKSDDAFAFGTLLFELFSTQLPFAGEDEAVVEAKIRSGSLPRALANIHCTDKLKKLVQRCWDYEADRRPSFAQMGPHFAPGACLLRRHSTSEPRLDQMVKPVAGNSNGGSSRHA